MKDFGCDNPDPLSRSPCHQGQAGQAESFFSNPLLSGPDSLIFLHILCDGVTANAGKIETHQQHLFSVREFSNYFILARMCNRNYFIHTYLGWAVKIIPSHIVLYPIFPIFIQTKPKKLCWSYTVLSIWSPIGYWSLYLWC